MSFLYQSGFDTIRYTLNVGVGDFAKVLDPLMTHWRILQVRYKHHWLTQVNFVRHFLHDGAFRGKPCLVKSETQGTRCFVFILTQRLTWTSFRNEYGGYTQAYYWNNWAGTIICSHRSWMSGPGESSWNLRTWIANTRGRHSIQQYRGRNGLRQWERQRDGLELWKTNRKRISNECLERAKLLIICL